MNKGNPKNTILKFVIFILIFNFLAASPLVYAEGETEEKSPIQETFNVREYLRIGGQEADKSKQGPKQGQAYFQEAEKRGISPIGAFIVETLDFLIAFIGVFSLLVFILGAILTIVSEGQEDRLQKGKQAMIYSLIGLILALFSYLITTFVQSLFY